MSSILKSRLVMGSAAAAIATLGLFATATTADARACYRWSNGYCVDWRYNGYYNNGYYNNGYYYNNSPAAVLGAFAGAVSAATAPRYYYPPPAYGYYSPAPAYGYYAPPPAYGYYGPEPSYGLVIR